LFQRDSLYVAAFKRKLKKNLSDARVGLSDQSPELGAAWLAAELEECGAFSFETRTSGVENLANALTERRNPRSENLEKKNARELVELFVDEENSFRKLCAQRLMLWRGELKSLPVLCARAAAYSTSAPERADDWACSTQANALQPSAPSRKWCRE
jgi:hypothetical protein